LFTGKEEAIGLKNYVSGATQLTAQTAGRDTGDARDAWNEARLARREKRDLQRCSNELLQPAQALLLGYYRVRVDKGAATLWEGLCTSLRVSSEE
jgi:hypothetical protein